MGLRVGPLVSDFRPQEKRSPSGIVVGSALTEGEAAEEECI